MIIQQQYKLTNLEFMILYKPNSYIKVFGKIKHFNGKFSINAFRIDLIKKFNDITYHFMQSIYEHVYKQKNGNKKNENKNESS